MATYLIWFEPCNRQLGRQAEDEDLRQGNNGLSDQNDGKRALIDGEELDGSSKSGEKATGQGCKT